MVHLQDSQVADVKFALGRTQEKRGETQQAMIAYSEALKKDPGRIDACVRLAILSDRQGDFTASRELYRKALAAHPDDPDILCNLGYSLYLQHRWAEAQEQLSRAVHLKPEHCRAHINLGLVLARMGRTEEAWEEFSRGGCNEEDAHLNLAYTALLSESWAEAQVHYAYALRINPSSEAATKGLRNLQTVLARVKAGKPEQARRSTAPATARERTSTEPAVSLNSPVTEALPAR
jgi:Flp pilus assembly protein TadD